eukprot:5105873-Lingulodinium_polyedra.AAC.1
MAVGPEEVAEATLRHFGATEAADITDLDTLRKALHDRPRAEESPVPIACVPTRRNITAIYACKKKGKGVGPDGVPGDLLATMPGQMARVLHPFH